MKHGACHKKEAGVGTNGKRQRSTDSDDGIVASKSAKVGTESVGKAAARSRPVRDVSALAVIGPDVESEKRLQVCRLAADIAQKDAEHAQAKLSAVRAEAKTLREQAGGGEDKFGGACTCRTCRCERLHGVEKEFFWFGRVPKGLG